MKAFLILLFLISITAKAQSPFYFGSGEAVNLTPAIKFSTGVKTITGALNPTLVAVDAPKGSSYTSTNGTSYVKQDAGLTTNWFPLAAIGSTVINDLTDVNTLAPIDGDHLVFNGVNWVNQLSDTVSAGRGVILFPDPTYIVNSYGGMPASPAITGSVANPIVTSGAETLFGYGYLYPPDLDRTTISGGEWEFGFYANTNITAGTSQLGYDIYKANLGAGTMTVTGTGTSRTCTSSAGIFVAGDANAGQRLASYVQTPVGTFQITAFSSATAVTCATLVGYVNETAVTYTAHRKLFGTDSSNIDSTSTRFLSKKSVQPSFSVALTDKLALRVYAITSGARTVNFYTNGTATYSRIATPLITTHNDLAGLQGGVTAERFHLTQPQAIVATQSATTSLNGFLNSTDWNTFNTKVAGPVSSADNEIALFNGATGKIIKAATGTGFVKSTSGAYSTQAAIALTADVTGVLPLANGGSSKALTASNGAIAYSDVDSLELLAPGTSGQILQTNGVAAPSFVNKSVSGKAQNTASVTLEELQVPNNLLTLTGTGKYLNETGNDNLLSNPSFEHSTYSEGWSLTGTATFSEELRSVNPANVQQGNKSLKIVTAGQTFDVLQVSNLYAAAWTDGENCYISTRVKSTHSGTITIYPIVAGVAQSQTKDVITDGKNRTYTIPFICGGTNNGINISSTSGTGTTYIDDNKLDAGDLRQSHDASKIAGESYFAGTTSCVWSRTSTTMGAFTTTAACPGPTIVRSSLGTWASTDSDLPRQTVNNLPAGTYKATFHVGAVNMSVNAQSALAINDGTTTCEAVSANNSNATGAGITVSCTFKYSNSGNRVFELYAGSASGTLTVVNGNTAPSISTKFILEYFGSDTTYSSTNADTDWASCGHTTSDFAGFGTVSAIETQCKRDGGDLLMKGKFTSGTSTAVEARLNLKLGGTTLTSKGSSVIPSIQISGKGAHTVAFGVDSITLIEPSVTYVTFGIQNGSFAGLAKRNGNDIISTGNGYTFSSRIPITGWENSNLIIGSFKEVMTVPGVDKPKTCHYAFGGASATLASPVNCTTGTCVEVYDSCGTGSPPAFSATGTYQNVTFASGTFANSSYVDCSCVGYDTTPAHKDCTQYFDTGDQTWQANASGGFVSNIYVTLQTGVAANAYVQISCKGSAP